MSQKIIIQEAPFRMQDEYQKLKSVTRAVGAVAIFVGVVRDINDGADVHGLHLEHYPGMTEREIGKILAMAEDRWPLHAATVIHRVGALDPGDEIVLVGIAAGHRGDAFAACEFVIDYLKTRATFWKKEQTSEGEGWLTTREADLSAAATWEE